MSRETADEKKAIDAIQEQNSAMNDRAIILKVLRSGVKHVTTYNIEVPYWNEVKRMHPQTTRTKCAPSKTGIQFVSEAVECCNKVYAEWKKTAKDGYPASCDHDGCRTSKDNKCIPDKWTKYNNYGYRYIPYHMKRSLKRRLSAAIVFTNSIVNHLSSQSIIDILAALIGLIVICALFYVAFKWIKQAIKQNHQTKERASKNSKNFSNV